MTPKTTDQVFGTAWVVVGLLWATLTGLCTLNFVPHDLYSAALAIFSPMVAIGLLPIALGVARLFRERMAGRVLVVIGVVWAAASAATLVANLLGQGPQPALPFALFCAIYMLPGALVILRGLVILSRTR